MNDVKSDHCSIRKARIRVVESGEALDYPLTALLSDPQA